MITWSPTAEPFCRYARRRRAARRHMIADAYQRAADPTSRKLADRLAEPWRGVRRETLAENVQTALRDKLTARILEREQLDAQVETALAGVMANGFDAQAGALGGLLRDRLQHHPALSWRAPLVELAQEMADKHLTG